MIKLQDFAKQQGVTDRAIQKHLKTYAEELDGLYQRKGPNGTWLTDEACEILRSKMKQAPAPIVFEEDPRVKELEAANKELQKQLNEANLNFQKYAANTAATLAEANKQLQLAERASSLEAENSNLRTEKCSLEQKIAEAEKASQKLSEELTGANKALEDENHLLKNELEVEKTRKLTFKERLLGKKLER